MRGRLSECEIGRSDGEGVSQRGRGKVWESECEIGRVSVAEGGRVCGREGGRVKEGRSVREE